VQQPSLAVAAEERGYLDTRLLWEAREKPPALVILDDVVAKGAMQALLELRVRVPEDLCLVHTVNRGAGIFYPLAAPRVEYDPADFVGRAADLLLELLAEPELPPRTVYVTPRLRLEDGTIRSL
jgi:DNA-binding LacI/PurR family transcriptional regulator